MRNASNLPVMLITGTSKGIGKGMAQYFASHGYYVVGCSRGEATFEMTGYHHSRVDISDETQVRGWVRQIKENLKQIDVLVCNAGIVQSALLMTVTPKDVLETFMNVHIAGTFYVCREVSKAMIQRKQGRIITVSSIGVPMHLEGTSAYSATKSAVVEMTKVLAKELSSLGITCNVLAPALIMTDPAKEMGTEWYNKLIDKQTIKRTVTIEEICNVVSFFAAPESRCITGQVINMGLVV